MCPDVQEPAQQQEQDAPLVEPPPPDELEDWEPPEAERVDVYRCQHIDNLLWQTRPDHILPELIVRNSVTLMVSEPHVGKTLMSMDLLLALAAQQPFLGRQAPEPVKGLAFWLDSPVWDLRNQLESVAAGRGIVPKDIREHVFYKPRAVGWRIDLNSEQHVAQVIDTIKVLGVKVCVMDCFSNCNSADENSRSAMELVMMRAAKIAHNTSVALVLTDHTPVMPRAAHSVYQARGSSVKEAAADAVWHLRRMPNGDRELRVAKARGMLTAGVTFSYTHEKVKTGGVRFKLLDEYREEDRLVQRGALEEIVAAACDGAREVSDVIQKVLDDGIMRDASKAEHAVRNALTRLRKRGEVERVRRNVWARVGGDDSLDELAGLAGGGAEDDDNDNGA